MVEQNKQILDQLFKDMPAKTGIDEIIIIVDRSGSMATIKDDAEGGINTFIKQQQDLPGKANLTLVEFDDKVDRLYDRANIKEVTKYSLLPRGWTALYDAIGKTLADFKSVELGTDGTAGVVVIVTDGQENGSREYKQADVFGMITEFQDKGWNFLFLAAGQDAMAAGTRMGINSADTMSYAATKGGIDTAYETACLYASTVRSSNKLAFYAHKADLEIKAMDGQKVVLGANGDVTVSTTGTITNNT